MDIAYEFEGNFLYYVRLLKRMYERTLSEAAAECGLSFPEADVLSFLRENPEFDTARDVALYREVSRAYVSKAVEMLVQRGYVEVQPDREDRRYQHLIITESAHGAVDTLHEAQMDFYARVTRGLTQNEFAAMLSAIGKCAMNLAADEM